LHLKIKMEQVIVSSVSTGEAGGEDRLTENVTLNFAKVAVDYEGQSEKGAKSGQGNMTWNIAANKA